MSFWFTLSGHMEGAGELGLTLHLQYLFTPLLTLPTNGRAVPEMGTENHLKVTSSIITPLPSVIP